jgi:hypothetical protein
VAALTYRRRDVEIAVSVRPPRRRGGPSRLMVIGPEGERWERAVRDPSEARLGSLGRALLPLPPLGHPLAWPTIALDRVALHVPPEASTLDWEGALRSWAAGRVIVRTSPVPPPFLDRPLPLPLRIGHASLPGGDPAMGRRLRTLVDDVTAWARGHSHVAAVEVLTGNAAHIDQAIRRRGWPVLDVLHLDGPLPVIGLLDPDHDGPPGTLGWVEGRAARYQVRLLVITTNDLQAARQLAARLGARGGPAVIVAPPALVSPGQEPILWLYADLIHDTPLDAAVQRLAGIQLFAGAGREDALRVSAGTEHVVTAARTRRRAPLHLNALVGDELLARFQPSTRHLIRADVDRLVRRWPTLDYSGEGRGLYPTLESTEVLTRAIGKHVRHTRRHPVARGQRFVNATLLRQRDRRPSQQPMTRSGEGGTAWQEVAQDGPAVVAGATYLLRVDVGPLAAHVKPSGALELLVEDQLWHPTERGLWTELAVAGIGCTVLGDPVQPLWIPRYGPSDPRYVAVRVERSGVAVLRYTLYHRGHVIQSFRLGAIVVKHSNVRIQQTARRALADALALGAEDVGERNWYARLEFSTVARVDEAAALAPRKVAIIANDVAGTPMLTVKSAGNFAVSTPTDIGRDVSAARTVLNEISGAAQGNYRFGYQGDPNATNDEFFSFVLGRLATVGWSLCTRVVPKDDPSVLDALREPDAVIQVAHVLRDKVVPWALVYDRRYDANARKAGGRPVEHVACTAPLPDAQGQLGVTSCGTDPACQLHPDRLADRAAAGGPTVTPATVACPLGFWGVRHQIEIPPRQVAPGRGARPAVPAIKAAGAARVLLAFNSSIESTQDHRPALVEAVAAARRGGPPAHVVSDRDDVVDALGDTNLDVVYVFCHAQGGDPPAPWPPQLEFQELTDASAVPLTAAELPEVTWSHHPLVVLNGCGTTGFSNTATSEFIAALVDARGAAAVVGADVPVAEVLAAEVGQTIVKAVLNGDPLGAALAGARRRLLSRRNPLGLAYTLYGSADLALE